MSRSKQIHPPLKAGDATDKSMIDMLYDQINEILGGSNQNQYFCLTFPGTLLSPDSYSYDITAESKPLTVQANESVLTNKLFDACEVTGSDNGRSLPQQYSTALNMLTPKLNSEIVDAKNALRDMLMSSYPYDFGDGLNNDLTLQQVFYRLYDEWLDSKEQWSQLQADKQAELALQFPGNTAEANKKRQNAYLLWYETVAESYLERVNERYGKILAVFSPTDMKILEGILDSGSGAELQEARQVLNNVRKPTPNGSYVYPVTLEPANWFELLDNSFTGVDLLESAEVLSQKMYLLSSQKNIYMNQIEQISNAIPREEIEEAKSKLEAAKSEVNKAEQDLIDAYGSGIETILSAAFEIVTANRCIKLKENPDGEVSEEILGKLTNESGLDSNDKDLISKLKECFKKTVVLQQQYIVSLDDLSSAQQHYIEAYGLEELKSLLIPLQNNLNQLDLQIQSVAQKIALSENIVPNSDGGSTLPRQIPAGYAPLTILSKASSLNTSTSKSSSSSVSKSGFGFFFAGHSHNSTKSQSAYESITSSQENEIEIGMSIAKVTIQREWFNPGLFLLSKDMYNVTSEKISPEKSYSDGFTKNRFTEMNQCIFPCFPTAFVVARDVTIKITTQDNFSQQTSQAVEEHASKGGGFLFFSNGSSSSSSSSQSSAHVSSNGKNIIIRFTDPQILGYYIEATPADCSSPVDKTDPQYTTVLDFAKKYKEVLKAHAEQFKQV